MQTRLSKRARTSRWVASVSLALATLGAAAEPIGSAADLRVALKAELAPVALSIEQRARIVAAELVATVTAGLASHGPLRAPHSQRGQPDSGHDAS